MSSQDRSSQVRLCQVRTSKVRTGQVRFGQLRTYQSKDTDQFFLKFRKWSSCSLDNCMCIWSAIWSKGKLECGPAQSYLFILLDHSRQTRIFGLVSSQSDARFRDCAIFWQRMMITPTSPRRVDQGSGRCQKIPSRVGVPLFLWGL